MTTSTQLQLRRGTATQCAAMTPATGEPIMDTTNGRLKIGNGSAAGGIAIPNAADIQNQTMIYPTVGGTGNAITFTNAIPVAALVAGMCFEWKCTNANTTGVTIAVDGLTAKNEYKVASGSLTALASGDHIVGVIYRSRYDGTQFQTQPWAAATALTANYSQSNPSNATSATGMQGLAGSITPNSTGVVEISVSGSISLSNQNNVTVTGTMKYGTGSAPAHGDASTGTTFGAPVTFQTGTSGPNAVKEVPFSSTGIISGLTPGVAIWIDISNSDSTGTYKSVSITAREVH